MHEDERARLRGLVAKAREVLANHEWNHRHCGENVFCPSCEDMGPEGEG